MALVPWEFLDSAPLPLIHVLLLLELYHDLVLNLVIAVMVDLVELVLGKVASLVHLSTAVVHRLP
jgi:hypothetical protein